MDQFKPKHTQAPISMIQTLNNKDLRTNQETGGRKNITLSTLIFYLSHVVGMCVPDVHVSILRLEKLNPDLLSPELPQK